MPIKDSSHKNICWKCTHPQTTDNVDKFVSLIRTDLDKFSITFNSIQYKIICSAFHDTIMQSSFTGNNSFLYCRNLIYLTLHHLLTNGSSAVNGCRYKSPNSWQKHKNNPQLIHTTPVDGWMDGWCGVVWTLILTAPIHCRISIG